MGQFRDLLEKPEQDYEAWKTNKLSLEKIVDFFDAKLKKFPKGDMGLVPDDVKDSKDFKDAKKAFDVGFKNLQKFNKASPKDFLRQLSKESRRRK